METKDKPLTVRRYKVLFEIVGGPHNRKKVIDSYTAQELRDLPDRITHEGIVYKFLNQTQFLGPKVDPSDEYDYLIIYIPTKTNRPTQTIFEPWTKRK